MDTNFKFILWTMNQWNSIIKSGGKVWKNNPMRKNVDVICIKLFQLSRQQKENKKWEGGDV